MFSKKNPDPTATAAGALARASDAFQKAVERGLTTFADAMDFTVYDSQLQEPGGDSHIRVYSLPDGRLIVDEAPVKK